ncbi:MAG: hypothetical protein J7515_09475 [Caulobacter sp.]|nr:hypothetical protein [Caulobacter sp.]
MSPAATAPATITTGTRAPTTAAPDAPPPISSAAARGPKIEPTRPAATAVPTPVARTATG